MTVRLFISYAREDKNHLTRLLTHLNPLITAGKLDVWHDGRISAGEDWGRTIDKNLRAARVILLLISPQFLSSQPCQDEMNLALARHAAGKATVIPIRITHVPNREKLECAKLQWLPREDKPITDWKNRDEAMSHVVEEIMEVLTGGPANTARPWIVIWLAVIACLCLPIVGVCVLVFPAARRAVPSVEPESIAAETEERLKNFGFSIERIRPATNGPVDYVRIEAHGLDLEDLDAVGRELQKIRCLVSLTLDDCDQLKSLGGLAHARLVELNAPSCDRLAELWEDGAFEELRTFNLQQCKRLSNLRGCAHLKRLKTLNVSGCRALTELSDLSDLPELNQVDLSKCTELRVLDVGGDLGAVKELQLVGCSKLKSLAGLKKMPNVEVLDLRDCVALSSLDELSSLKQLTTLLLCRDKALTNAHCLADLPRLQRVYVGPDPQPYELVNSVLGKRPNNKTAIDRTCSRQPVGAPAH